jgi:hypothetical protein
MYGHLPCDLNKQCKQTLASSSIIVTAVTCILAAPLGIAPLARQALERQG